MVDIKLLVEQKYPNGNPYSLLLNQKDYKVDTYCDLEMRLTANVKNINNFSIGGQVSYTFKAPYTKRNARHFFKIGQEYKALIGNGLYSIVGDLRVQGVVKKSGIKQYDLKFQSDSAEWISELKKIKIKDLPFLSDGSTGNLGEVVIDYANIVQRFYGTTQQPALHQSQCTIGYYNANQQVSHYAPLPNNYGGYSGWTADLQDLRLCLWVLDIINLMFYNIGYTLQSNYMSTAEFRKLSCYILKEDFWAQGSVFLSNTIAFCAIVSVDKTFLMPIRNAGTFETSPLSGIISIFNDSNLFDNDSVGDGFDNANAYFLNLGVFALPITCYTTPTDSLQKFSISVTLENPTGNATESFFLGICVIAGVSYDTNAGFEKWSPTTYVQGGTSKTIYLETGEWELKQGDIVFAYVSSVCDVSQSIVIKQGSFFKNSVLRKNIVNGDTIKLSDIIAENYTCYDFLNGVVHIHNLGHITNNTKKTIVLEPMMPYLFYNTTTQSFEIRKGFYDDPDGGEVVQLDNIINECEDFEEFEPQERRLQYLQMGYKTDGGDKYAEYVGKLIKNGQQGEKTNPYDSLTFLGGQYEKGTTKSENPFFSLTISDYARQLACDVLISPLGLQIPNFIAQKRIYVPHIYSELDNANNIGGLPPAKATKIQPRIFIVDFVYNTNQAFVLKNLVGYIKAESTATQSVPNVYMVNNEAASSPINGKNYILANNISYGSVFELYQNRLGTNLGIVYLGGLHGANVALCGAYERFYKRFVFNTSNSTNLRANLPYIKLLKAGLGIDMLKKIVAYKGKKYAILEIDDVDVGDMYKNCKIHLMPL